MIGPKRKITILVLLLLSASLARAQSSKETQDRNYQQLFTLTGGFFDKLAKTCKTEACATLAADGVKLISEGKDKHARGILVAEDRAAWHAKLESALLRSIGELQAGIAKKHGILRPIPTAALRPPTCLKPVQAENADACHLCYDVMEQAGEICALYAFVSPEAALICLAWATLNFGNCIGHWCNPEISLYNAN